MGGTDSITYIDGDLFQSKPVLDFIACLYKLVNPDVILLFLPVKFCGKSEL